MNKVIARIKFRKKEEKTVKERKRGKREKSNKERR